MAVNDHCYDFVKISLSKYAKSLDLSGRNVYIDKLKIEFDRSCFYFPDPYVIPKEKWMLDPMLWPRIEYPDIVNYLVDSKGDFTSKCLKNYKSLAAYDYVISGKVQNVSVFQPEFPLDNHRILGADVQPSQRVRNECFKPWIISTEEGTVIMAHCTCMAGFGETCSHVAAVLFQVELVIRNIVTAPGPTERLCAWNNNFSDDVLSLPMASINLQKEKWNVTEESKKRIVNVMPHKKLPPLTDLQIERIRQIQPNAVYFSSFIDESETESASDGEDCLPPPLIELVKTFIGKPIDRNSIKLQFTSENCQCLEEATKNQGLVWKEHKKGRVTASNFGAVLKRKKWNDGFAERILFPQSLNVPAIKWGREKEKVALAAYLEVAKKTHAKFEYNPAGLHIHPNDPHLGASPDGKINCQCCGEGVLEIKCPYSHRECDPKIISSVDKAFCLDERNDLKDTHNYYSQVQGQMALCNVAYCDFVIWTKKGFLISRIFKDSTFWENSKPVLDKIYHEICLPFLLKKL